METEHDGYAWSASSGAAPLKNQKQLHNEQKSNCPGQMERPAMLLFADEDPDYGSSRSWYSFVDVSITLSAQAARSSFLGHSITLVSYCFGSIDLAYTQRLLKA